MAGDVTSVWPSILDQRLCTVPRLTIPTVGVGSNGPLVRTRLRGGNAAAEKAGQSIDRARRRSKAVT